MRSCVLICSMALLAIPAATTFSQDMDMHMGMGDTGVYFEAGGGLAIVPEIMNAKGGFWFEKDGKEHYFDPPVGGEKKDGTPTLEEFDPDPKYGFDLGWTVGGALGYDFGDIRAELEVTYTSANQNKVFGDELKNDNYDTLPSLSTLSFMANGWYDIDTGTVFSPYVGLGAGGFQATLSGGEPKNAPTGFEVTEFTGWGLAFQGGAGVAVEVTDGLSIQVGYNLFAAPLDTVLRHETDVEDNPLIDADKMITGIAAALWVHRIEIGVSYRFPF